MRVIALKIGDQQIDLHPSITVLNGLGPAQQNYVVASLARMLNGDGNALVGQFECHQLIADVNPVNIAALGLPGDLAVVVRAEELPGATLGEYEPAFEARISELRAELDAAYHDSHQLRLRHQEAREETQAATIELETALSQLDTAAPAEFNVAKAHFDELVNAKEGQVHSDLSYTGTRKVPSEEALARLEEQLAALDLALEDDRLVLLDKFQELEAKELRLAELNELWEVVDQPEDEVDHQPGSDQPDGELASQTAAGYKPNETTSASELEDPAESNLEVETFSDTGLNEAAVAELAELVEAVASYQPTIKLIPHPEAMTLADELNHLGRQEAKLRVELKTEGLHLADFDTQIAQVEAEIETLERQSRRHVVPAELEAEIERLYEALDETESRRFGRRPKRSTHEVRQELDAALAEAGFPTYAAYVMGRVAPTVNHTALNRLSDAQERLAELVAERQGLALQINDDPRVRSLASSENRLRRAAMALLPQNQPNDQGSTAEFSIAELEAALRELRLEAPPAKEEVSPPDQLRHRLEELGIPAIKTDDDALVTLAKDAIETAREPSNEAIPKAPQIVETADELEPDDLKDVLPVAEPAGNPDNETADALRRDIVALETDIDRLRAHLIQADNDLVAKEELSEQLNQQMLELTIEPVRDETLGDPAAGLVIKNRPENAELDHASKALEAAKTRLQLHEEAKAALQKAEDKLQQARRAESMNFTVKRSADQRLQALQSELDEILERAPLPKVTWNEDENLASEIEWYLLAKVSALRKVSFVGSIPVVLNDVFRSLSEHTIAQLSTALKKVSETSQVIYVGNSPNMVAWAGTQPIEVAALVAAPDGNG